MEQMEKDSRQPAKWDGTKIALAITAGVAVLLLVGLLIWLVASGMLGSDKKDTDPMPTNAEQQVITPSDEELKAANSTVVATIGEQKLTNGQLQVYYWLTLYNFLNSEDGYMYMYYIDLSQPLSGQIYNSETGETWEDLFLSMALDTWCQIASLQEMARREGFQLSAEQQQNLETMESTLRADQELLKQLPQAVGVGATVEDYIHYNTLDYFASAYYAHLQQQYTPTAQQLEDYYNENKETFQNAGYDKDAGNLVDVRHILIKPEGGVINEDGRTYTYTDAEWEAGQAEAQKVYDEWLAGDKTEESFSAMAAKYSADGSASSGGMIDNSSKNSSLVTEFKDWIFADGRKHGDHGIVKTVFGYHIMFYVEAEEAWIRYGNSLYTSGNITARLEELAKELEMQTDYDNILIAFVNLLGE